MKKQCEIKRTIKDLFSVYSCDKCRYRLDDYYFYLGRNIVAVYYITNCRNDTEESYLVNTKVRSLINDAIKHQKRIHLMILDEFIPSKYYLLLDAINELGLDCQILTIK